MSTLHSVSFYIIRVAKVLINYIAGVDNRGLGCKSYHKIVSACSMALGSRKPIWRLADLVRYAVINLLGHP